MKEFAALLYATRPRIGLHLPARLPLSVPLSIHFTAPLHPSSLLNMAFNQPIAACCWEGVGLCGPRPSLDSKRPEVSLHVLGHIRKGGVGGRITVWV